MIPQLQSGKIKALAVQSKTRSPLFPEVPTFAEAGLSEEFPPTWFGLFAPAGTPQPILVKLATEVDRIERDPGFRTRMYFDRGIEPANARLAEFGRFIEQERKIAERMVREAGLQPE